MLVFMEPYLRVLATLVAVASGIFALYRKFPDRRRSKFKEQHDVLRSLLSEDIQEQHDLGLEAAFRFCFEAALPAQAIRYLVDHSFSLVEIERYSNASEYISWDSEHNCFIFKHKRYRKEYQRWAVLSFYFLSYALLAGVAYYTAVSPIGEVVSRLLLAVLLLVPAILFLQQGSRLYSAHRFMRLPDHRRFRTSSITA